MPTIGSTPRPAYVYDAQTDTWVPVGVTPHTHGEAVSLAGVETLSNKTLTAPILRSPEERINVIAAAPAATADIDVATAGIVYYTTNAANNSTFNFRASSTDTLNSMVAVNDSVTVSVLVTNGGTAYRPTAFTVDGSAVTPKWSGGTAPAAGNASSIDAYSFTIIKTANATFTVLAAGPVKYA